MSLKVFHVAFVSASSLLAFVFGGWCLSAYRAGQGAGWLAAAVASLAVGLALIAYGFWFWRKITTRSEEDRKRRKLIRRVPAVVLVGLLSDRAAWACTVCYGAAEAPMIDAARTGVFLLFGLVLLMQISFAAFFVYLWRRARRYRRGDAEHGVELGGVVRP